VKENMVKQILVVDLEATCWETEPPPEQRSEIIEIGCTVLEAPDGRWEVADSYGVLVKPLMSYVSEFCEQLTGITQKAVIDYGYTLEDALQLAVPYGNNQIAWASWGLYDWKKVQDECKFFGIKNPLPYLHLNVKALFTAKYITARCSLGKALNELGWAFDGIPHRGEDDSVNIARVLAHILNGGN
jgi:inhibitor of KinA sporulation pathway (predicted exonuclease)